MVTSGTEIRKKEQISFPFNSIFFDIELYNPLAPLGPGFQWSTEIPMQQQD